MEVTVKDSFEIKGRVALEYGAGGVVAVFDIDSSDELPEAGKPVLVMRQDGWMYRTFIGEVKEHSPTARSCFLSNMTVQDVPVGSRLRWGKSLWPDAQSPHAGAAAATR